MTVSDLKDLRKRLNVLTGKRRFYEAFNLLIGVTESLMNWELTDRIKRLEESYKYMLQYAVDGMDDPGRADFLESIAEELDGILAKLIIMRKVSDNDYDIFSNTYRRLSSLKNQMTTELTVLQSNPSAADIYKCAPDLFNLLWVSDTVTDSERKSLIDLTVEADASKIVGNMVVGGILLRSLSMGYSTADLRMLLQIYTSAGDKTIRIRALTVFVILLMHFNGVVSTAKVKALIDKVKAEDYDKDVTAIVLELLRTKETERINKKMQTDILPNMMKMGPKIREKFRNLDEEELSDLEENPEWKKLLKDSGILNSLEEMNRLQLEGADVMMSTFGHLKSFPFFNDVYSWFLPFDAEIPDVAGIMEGKPVLKEFIGDSEVLCDSDKYSLVFSVGMMSHNAREGLLNNIKDQFNAMKDMMKKSGDSESTVTIANNYIKNLYRFFNLYRRKGEIPNPFVSLPNPVDCPLIKACLTIKDFEKAGEMLLRQEQWNDALKVFVYIERLKPLSAELMQKIGFCMLKLADYDQAMTYFLHSEMLDPENVWTLNKIAFCARQTGQWSTAIEYLEKVEQKEPTVKTAVAIGRCEMELGNYKAAVKQFYKAYYLNPDSPKVLRYLCRALVLSLDLEGAQKQLQKLMDNVSDAEDYILSGHIHFINKDYRAAIDDYVRAYRLSNSDRPTFIEKIEADRAFLTESNGNREILNLTLEQLNYVLDC